MNSVATLMASHKPEGNDTIIRGCTIRTGDDAISPKTWQGYGPLVNLLIEDTVFHSRSGGIHFGSVILVLDRGLQLTVLYLCF